MAVDSECAAYKANKADWKRMRDVLSGQTAMRSVAENYLRRPGGMTNTPEWERYVEATPFFEATQRTLEGLTGLAFYRDPELTLPSAMKAFVDDVTQDGVPLRQFAEKVFEEVMGMGRVGILLDFPKADPTIRSLRDEEAAGRRPFARIYTTENIFHWSTSEVNGVVTLTEVRLWEVEWDKESEWVTRHRQRIRILQLVPGADGKWFYRQRVFVHNRWEAEDEKPASTLPQPTTDTTVVDKDDWTEQPVIIPQLPGRKPMPYMPFWIVNPTDQSPHVVRPPLLGLANLNIAHFNTSGALENGLFWCGNPQPYIAGVQTEPDKPLVMGSSEAWLFKDPQTKVDFLAFGADGLAPLEKRLDRLEQHMAVMGARMLSAETRGVEAAETARIHRQGEISVLAGACGSVSRSLFDMATCACQWMEAETTDLAVKIQTAFYDAVITVADALGLVKLWQAGFMAPQDVLASLKKGELVAGNRTLEDIVADNQSSPIQPIMPGLTDSTTGSSPGQPDPAPAGK